MYVTAEEYERREATHDPVTVEQLQGFGFTREEAEVLVYDEGWGEAGSDPPSYDKEPVMEEALYRPQEREVGDEEVERQYVVDDPREDGDTTFITFDVEDTETLYQNVYDDAGGDLLT